ncbi:MAG: leucine-rich repeat protein [Ruminococcus sp.]|nr:leucine-rich repeat protein [Ruminococcus sp.]
MKKFLCLLVSLIIFSSVLLSGCTTDSATATTKPINSFSETTNEENASQNIAAEKDTEMRNKYKMNTYVSGNLSEFYQPDSNGNLVLYDKAPYFNILDEMYIKHNDALNAPDDDTSSNKLWAIVDEYEDNLSKAPKHSDFVVTDYKDGVCINSYKGSEQHVVIPATINGKKVIKIGLRVFQGECDILLESPFQNHNIKSITLPSTVKEIVMDAFNCYNADSQKDYLENIYVDSENPYYASVDGILYNKDKTCLLQIPLNYQKKTIEISEGTKAVYCTCSESTDTVVIPSSVISFGEEFDEFGKKRTTNFRDIFCTDPSAVYYMADVSNFEVSENNKYYSSEDGVLYNKDKTRLFLYPEQNKRKNFVVPDSVKVIDEAIDFGSTKLKSITIGRNVKEIYATCNSIFEQKLTIKGYRNTVAEDFVKKQQKKYDFTDDDLSFVAID